jgi:crotonobetainyl-CoA:carnitine CoA-transferase CaiB-like acyl-CoA transferase
MEGLEGVRVVEIADQVAGPYCGKLFVDAGAEVVKVESPAGDSLRRWSATGADLRGEDSALFAFLNAGKRSVVGGPTDTHVAALLAAADLVIEAHGLETDAPRRVDAARLRREHPSLVVLSITPYGLSGPWAARPATEFTLQAEGGSIGMRGAMGGGEPFQAGGRIGEWAAGIYGAVAALPAVLRARATGQGEHVDLSLLETANLVYTQFSETMNRLMNGSADDPALAFLAPSVETPSIEPTADGWVGFCTNARQQFMDFLVLIERPDLQQDEMLAQVPGRMMRFAEWNEIVRGWTTPRTTEEIIERAATLRIPVAPVGNGETLPAHEQMIARRVFVRSADGRFVQPRRPYGIDDADPPAPGSVPRLGEHTAAPGFSRTAAAHAVARADDALPLAGLRVLDLTAWWAGPSATHLLATFGAEVVHVESTGRLDGMRMVGGLMSASYERWWEVAPHFLHANSNKLGITLDLDTAAGRELLQQLVRRVDAVVENFTPRVLEHFGLSWERVQALNPNAVLMRMPAFGLSGPWRDHPGFAQTMEQFSGLAWTTGHVADQPRIPRGPCDPLAGVHGAFALLVALARRMVSGRGHLVESTMVESALNVAAEQVVEWSAYGRLLGRDGNRSPLAAPQGLYPCAGGQPGMEVWVAICVADDAQWHALRAALGNPAWATDAALATCAGRRAAHDVIDEHLCAWTRTHERSALVAELRLRGVLASEVADPCRLLQTNPQLRARGYFEAPEHPVVGRMPLPSWPFRFERVARWLRTPAPTLGRDNERVLSGILGLSQEEMRTLAADGVIGTHPRGL